MYPNLSMGFARLAEDSIRRIRGQGENDKLGAIDKIIASSIGGALATWNQPIEVVRVEVMILYKNFNTLLLIHFLDAKYGQEYGKC